MFLIKCKSRVTKHSPNARFVFSAKTKCCDPRRSPQVSAGPRKSPQVPQVPAGPRKSQQASFNSSYFDEKTKWACRIICVRKNIQFQHWNAHMDNRNKETQQQAQNIRENAFFLLNDKNDKSHVFT